MRAARPAQNGARSAASEERSDCPDKPIFGLAEAIAYKALFGSPVGQGIPDLIGTFVHLIFEAGKEGQYASKSRVVGVIAIFRQRHRARA